MEFLDELLRLLFGDKGNDVCWNDEKSEIE